MCSQTLSQQAERMTSNEKEKGSVRESANRGEMAGEVDSQKSPSHSSLLHLQ